MTGSARQAWRMQILGRNESRSLDTTLGRQRGCPQMTAHWSPDGFTVTAPPGAGEQEPACVMPTDSSGFSSSWWQHAIKTQCLQNRLISDQTTGHLDAGAKPFQTQGLNGESRA